MRKIYTQKELQKAYKEGKQYLVTVGNKYIYAQCVRLSTAQKCFYLEPIHEAPKPAGMKRCEMFTDAKSANDVLGYKLLIENTNGNATERQN